MNIRSLTLLVALCLSVTLNAGVIIGIGNGGGFNTLGTVYSIDPFTGDVTAIGPSGTTAGYYPIATGPIPGTYFASSIVNHYLLAYPNAGSYGSPTFAIWDVTGPPYVLGDYAFDTTTGALFGLASSNALPGGLARLSGGQPIPGNPNSVALAVNIVAAQPVFPALTIIEYIQGLGLYGTDGHSAYLINEVTGAATPLTSLVYTGPTITGLAYDPGSGHLIGTSGVDNYLGGGGPSTIYNIDPRSGLVTVLNSNAPTCTVLLK